MDRAFQPKQVDVCKVNEGFLEEKRAIVKKQQKERKSSMIILNKVDLTVSLTDIVSRKLWRMICTSRRDRDTKIVNAVYLIQRTKENGQMQLTYPKVHSGQLEAVEKIIIKGVQKDQFPEELDALQNFHQQT